MGNTEFNSELHTSECGMASFDGFDMTFGDGSKHQPIGLAKTICATEEKSVSDYMFRVNCLFSFDC
jgi:hypothetical protein